MELCKHYPELSTEFNKVAYERSQENRLATEANGLGFMSPPSGSPSMKEAARSPVKWNSNFLSGANIYGTDNSSTEASSDFSSVQRRSSIATISSPESRLPAPVKNRSIADFNQKRRRSAVEISAYQKTTDPLVLSPPSLNPLSPSLSQFPGQQIAPRGQPFQYMSLQKRTKLNYVNGRRKLSLLRYNTTLPDSILIKVFELLDLKTLVKLKAVSLRWRQILYFAPTLFRTLDLSIYNTQITDEIVISIADFVGPRVEILDISRCYHLTDKGFSYLINEIGINGILKVLRMKSMWNVSAMSIMDVTVPSVGKYLEEIDLANCNRVRDEVAERLIGNSDQPWELTDLRFGSQQNFGCVNLKRLDFSYCKHLTDKTMYYIADHMSERLEYLSLKRCTTITDQGFSSWLYKRFRKLKTLILSDCTFLTQKTAAAIATSCGSLRELDLGFCCALDEDSVDILRLGCCYLETLNLSFCGNAVSDNSLLSLSLSLMYLKRLVLKGCVQVTRAGVDILLSGCCPLVYLDISQCKYLHIYPGGVEAVKLPVKEGTRSSFITSSAEKGVVEIVL